MTSSSETLHRQTHTKIDTGVDRLLRPDSVAILGASADGAKLNGRVLNSLIDKGFPGEIFPVNPKYDTLRGLACYRSLEDLPHPVDVVIIATPAAAAAEGLRAVARSGARAAVIFSSGFREVGGDGTAMEAELTAIAAQAGIRLVGPNSLGIINTFDNTMLSFSQYAAGPTPSGPAALVSGSGALATSTAESARRIGLNLGYLVAMGNESDVTLPEVLGAVVEDERITLCGCYLEGLRDGNRFVEVAARALVLGKPIVVTKLGRSAAGARAVASHTGSLAGEDRVFDGIAKQYGVIRAEDEEQLLDWMHTFSVCPIPGPGGIGILTRSGGAGALMTDIAEEVGLPLVEFSPHTTTLLREVVPSFGSLRNPVDVTAQGLADPTLIERTLQIILDDPAVAVATMWLGYTKDIDYLVQALSAVRARASKPFVVSWVGAPPEAVRQLTQAGVAVLRSPARAVLAAAALVRYGETRRRWLADEKARAATTRMTLRLPSEDGPVDSVRLTALLNDAGVSTLPATLLHEPADASAALLSMGGPVALKIESPDILHKTEVGGVELHVTDPQDAALRAVELMRRVATQRPQARLRGVLMQKMAPPGVEMVIGMTFDPVFGPVVMVGAGGVLIELMRDVVFAQAPVTELQAEQMLDGLHTRALLDGFRGAAAADRPALVRLISAVSRLGAGAGARLRELDLNPVIITSDGAHIADALLVLEKEESA